MSDIIKLLPDSVANQIAAGEVIQRPASAVKELLENAIDAGATDISLIIKNAGKTLVQVTDNGSGMSAIDARMCFERHATSKISKADDLFAIRTMGFRGEALASIAAIAQVEIKTKPHEDELGTHLIIEGSKLISQESCQCKPGTNIMVKNLFFNVPARRNFLKSNTAETRHIIEEFIRVSAINPKISFGFIHDDKVVFKLISGSLKSRIVALFSNSYNERLLTVEQKTDLLSVNGFIGKPEFAKKTRGEQYFFVNRRFIKHAYLNHAVANAFADLVPVESFPTYFLNIEIDPKEIDINIHPTKTEVNFRDARYVYAVIHAAVKQAIGKHSLTPTIDFNVDPVIESMLNKKSDKTLSQPEVKVDSDYNPFKNKSEKGDRDFIRKRDSGDRNWEKIFENQQNEEQALQTAGNKDQLSFKADDEVTKRFFQFNNRFILCNVKSGLMVINQKKAHERILYEQYLHQLTGSVRPSQQRLFPHNINFSPGDAEIIKSLKNDLSKLGFTIENLGANGFVINGIPADLKESDIENALERMIDNYKKEAQSLDYDKNANLARSMAGSTALKEGIKLSEKEMEDMFNRLFASNAPEVSPDGKRIINIITPSDFEKLMKK